MTKNTNKHLFRLTEIGGFLGGLAAILGFIFLVYQYFSEEKEEIIDESKFSIETKYVNLNWEEILNLINQTSKCYTVLFDELGKPQIGKNELQKVLLDASTEESIRKYGQIVRSACFFWIKNNGQSQIPELLIEFDDEIKEPEKFQNLLPGSSILTPISIKSRNDQTDLVCSQVSNIKIINFDGETENRGIRPLSNDVTWTDSGNKCGYEYAYPPD